MANIDTTVTMESWNHTLTSAIPGVTDNISILEIIEKVMEESLANGNNTDIDMFHKEKNESSQQHVSDVKVTLNLKIIINYLYHIHI